MYVAIIWDYFVTYKFTLVVVPTSHLVIAYINYYYYNEKYKQSHYKSNNEIAKCRKSIIIAS